MQRRPCSNRWNNGAQYIRAPRRVVAYVATAPAAPRRHACCAEINPRRLPQRDVCALADLEGEAA
jgi:hypothetical protein